VSRPAMQPPYVLVGVVLFLGAATIAMGTSVALPGLRDFNWAQDARAGRELIGWFAQLSGAGSDILPAGILFVLPVFAARWLIPGPRKKRKTAEQAWEDRQRKPTLIRALIFLAKEFAAVVAISAVLGALLAGYLATFVLPREMVTPAFVPDAAIAVVWASLIYLLLITAIDGLGLVDGAAALTFCGAAATLGKALVSVLPLSAPLVGETDPVSARALLASAIAVPIVIVLLRAQRQFEVSSLSRVSRGKAIRTTMSFRVVPEQTLRLVIGIFLWIATGAMVAAAAIGHLDMSAHTLDWLLFPAQPVLIALVFYWLATGSLGSEVPMLADQLRRLETYLPGLRPGAQTEDFLDGAFRRMLAAAALFAGAISALVALLFWLSGGTPLQSLQGLAWVWTVGASAAAFQRGVEGRTQRNASSLSLLRRFRWSPARAQFTLLCITALIDRKLAPEEKFEAIALGSRTRALHETNRDTLHRWLGDVDARRNDHAALIELATHAIEDYPEDADMRRAIFAQCADIAHADRIVNMREHKFLRFLAEGLRLAPADRDRIQAIIRVKNRH
jgi:preprotein translocase subunit SecY